MGVPGFFSWLLKRYNDVPIILNKIEGKIEILYLDANCLFHPQCFIILEKHSNITDRFELEELMINRILEYISFLINYVKPTESIYIAVDGVAPMAKINQQRKRRFKSCCDKKIYDEINKKHNVTKTNIWSNVCITPGTEFMENLHNALLLFINNRTEHFIYSSYHTAGEGEHKILEHLKQLNNKIVSIYGLDADLIFLSLASNKKNIYLLREQYQFNLSDTSENDSKKKDTVEETLCYVSIDMMRKYISDTVSSIILNKNNVELKNINVVDDFIFLCYFLGNDFIPHFPSIDIKSNGLDFLLDCYAIAVIKHNRGLVNISSRLIINNAVFIDFLQAMSCKEDYYFRKIFPNYMSSNKNKECLEKDPLKVDLWKLENMLYYDVDDPIMLGVDQSSEYMHRYYSVHFGIEHSPKSVDDICHNFLEGIIWTGRYYFEKCPSWHFQYKYTHAPFLQDLYNYVKNNNIDINKIKFILNTPITPFQQLLSVLPPQYDYLLPIEYQKLMNLSESIIIDLYPSKVELDMINKIIFWKCEALVPLADINRIIIASKDIPLTTSENIRNIIFPPYEKC